MSQAQICKVAVLGAGTMGAGIAAQVANSGVPVRLFDLDEPTAARARDGLTTRKPAPLMDVAVLDLIEPAGFDRLDLVADCDWIVEAVVEQLEPKQALYRRLAEYRHAAAAVSSNTSGLRLAELRRGLPEELAGAMMITHFFNPPRYMPLLELVYDGATEPRLVRALRDFCERRLGKVVVEAKDTPCFIANRIGVLNLMAGLHITLETGLSVEQADAVAGRPMGFPRTGVFGLIDLVGFDVVALVCDNLRRQLAPSDAARPFLDLPPVARRMLEAGMVGRKSGGGFYRTDRDSGTQSVLDLETFTYRARRQVELPCLAARSPAELVAASDAGGAFAWRLLSTTLCYAAAVAGEVADDIGAVDRAMREGFSWRWGPFELLDQLGPAAVVQRLSAEGRAVPALLAAVVERGAGTFYAPAQRPGQGVRFWRFDGGYQDPAPRAETWRIADVARDRTALLGNAAASLWDAGDGVALLELHSKMNAIDEHTVAALEECAQRAGRDYKALVVGTDGGHFSVGANLQVMLDAARAERREFLDRFIGGLQRALLALKQAPCPVVMAAHGYALGGGCELALHGDRIQAHAELSIGLVEVRVGLIPAGGGCKEMLLRHAARGGTEAAFDLIAGGVTSTSALHGRALGYLTDADGITMHRDRVLSDAKALALELAAAYSPPRTARFNACPERAAALVGRVERRLDSGAAAPHDLQVARRLAWVLTGGDAAAGTPLDEHDLLELERAAFLELLALEPTRARMAHMLETGKPLRN